MSEAAASLQAETDGVDANESASPPAKRAKTDSRSASLKLPATAGFDDRLIIDSRDDDRLRKKIEFHIPSFQALRFVSICAFYVGMGEMQNAAADCGILLRNQTLAR